MWKSLSYEVHKLILSSAAFQAIAGNRYYVVYEPKDLVTPYAVTPGDAFSTSWYTMGSGANEDIFWPIHVFCDIQNGGPEVVLNLSQVICNTMHNASLDVDGYDTIRVHKVYSSGVTKDFDDPEMYHQVNRFSIKLAKKD